MKQLTIFVGLGKGWKKGKDWKKNPQPSEDHKITGIAIGLLLLNNPNSIAILSGGYTAGPNNPSEALMMKEAINSNLKNARKISESRIILEENSLDTIDNAEFSKVLISNKFPDAQVIAVTAGFHMARTEKIFKRYFPKILVMPSEPLLITEARADGDNTIFLKIKGRERPIEHSYKILQFKENIIRAISWFRKGEELLHYLSRRRKN